MSRFESRGGMTSLGFGGFIFITTTVVSVCVLVVWWFL